MAKKFKMKHSENCTCERCKPTYVEPELSGKQYETLHDLVTAISVEKRNAWYVNVTVTNVYTNNSVDKSVKLDEYENSYAYWDDETVRKDMLERRQRLATDPRFDKED